MYLHLELRGLNEYQAACKYLALKKAVIKSSGPLTFRYVFTDALGFCAGNAIRMQGIATRASHFQLVTRIHTLTGDSLSIHTLNSHLRHLI